MIFINLRKHTKTIMWVIAIFIVPAFVIWNIGSAVKNRRSGFAGKIFGQKVSWKEFALAKRGARNDAWMRFGDQMDPSFNLDEQTWTRLIILHEAKNNDIKVGNKELFDYIKKLPTFQYAELSPENYAMIIARIFQQPPAEFEDGIRHSIMINKLMDKLTADIEVSDQEIKDAYKNDREAASVSYILIDPKNFTESISLEDEAAIENYYKNNSAKFKKQDQVNVEYIEINLDQFKDTVEISDERITKYYENNKDEFKVENINKEEQPVQYKDLAEVKESIREKLTEKEMIDQASELARQIMNRLYSDVKFSDVAEEYGLTAKKTGPFSMADEIPDVGLSFPFLKAAFSLDVGEVSEIIKTATAFYILKPIKKIPPYIPEYTEVKDQVKEQYKLMEAEKFAQAKGEQVREQLMKEMQDGMLDFKQSAEKLGYAVKQVNNITRSGYIQELGFAENFSAAAFKLQKNEISPLIKTPRGFCIMELEEIIPIDEEQFEKDKAIYQNRVLNESRARFLNKWFDDLKLKANPQIYVEENQLQ